MLGLEKDNFWLKNEKKSTCHVKKTVSPPCMNNHFWHYKISTATGILQRQIILHNLYSSRQVISHNLYLLYR